MAWRLIINTQFHQANYAKVGHGYNRIKLECQHEIVTKASVRLPKKNMKWCKECDRTNATSRPGSLVAMKAYIPETERTK